VKIIEKVKKLDIVPPTIEAAPKELKKSYQVTPAVSQSIL